MVSKNQEDKIIEETKKLVELFLTTGESDKELEKRTGISSSTVGRRLTNKERILTAFPNNGEEIFDKVSSMRKYNLQKGKILGGQISNVLNAYVQDDSGHFKGSVIRDNNKGVKFRLDLIYENEEEQMKFLLHIALTFRLKLNTLVDLFQMNEKVLLEKLLMVSGNAYQSLLYLIYHDNYNQDLAKANFINYYKELLYAMRKKDKIEQANLINSVTDSGVRKIKLEHKDVIDLSDEELEILLKYQLKYALSNNALANTFLIDLQKYVERIYLLLENKPELKERYDNLINIDMSRNSGVKYA